MIRALIILLPITLASIWLFFRFSPREIEKRRVRVFNLTVVVLGVALCVGLTLKIYFSMAGTVDRAWWPILAMLASLLVFSACLVIGGLVRNFLVFRTPRRE